jgi:hypothetical protein
MQAGVLYAGGASVVPCKETELYTAVSRRVVSPPEAVPDSRSPPRLLFPWEEWDSISQVCNGDQYSRVRELEQGHRAACYPGASETFAAVLSPFRLSGKLTAPTFQRSV